jgi:serine O-acetyltransferase
MAAADIVGGTLALLFPHFSDEHDCETAHIEAELLRLRATMLTLRTALARDYAVPPEAAVDDFFAQFPRLHRELLLDARAILDGDPAAVSVDEVILAYPGFYAVAVYRLAHTLHLAAFPLLPRLMTEFAHQRTGIDIHPGARIGQRFVIDHGTGIVIGETAEIGNGVKLYQGVTLGATVVDKELASTKRHPTLEDHVVVYANATILGGETVIGHDSIIGGNAWIVRSVPAFSFVGRDAEVRARRPDSDELEFYI